MNKNFLTAEWRKLAIANYAVEPVILQQYLPARTELDLWNDMCYVSLVGFMFLNTKVMGVSVPFHINFREVNLRFYVRYKDSVKWKRGVVFVKEIVSKAALSFVANTIYGENYTTMPMKHSWKENSDNLEIEYRWQKKKWHKFKVATLKQPQSIVEGSEEEFITEHYWGYTKHKRDISSEYGVEHPKWKIYPVNSYYIDVDFGLIYGNEFSELTNSAPSSVFLAEGSEIVVKRGRRI